MTMNDRLIVSILAICIFQTGIAQTVTHKKKVIKKIEKPTGSLVSYDMAAKVINHHNKIRAEVGVPPLVWNNDIATYAQLWANYLANENDCNMLHRQNADKNDKHYGENLFWGSSSTIFKPEDASFSWANEKADYTYSPCCGSNFSKIGHYTQMVWKNTKEMGLGIAACPTGGVIIVANYNPPGNFSGEYPY